MLHLFLVVQILAWADAPAEAPACRHISRADRTVAGVVLGGMNLEDVRGRLGPAILQTSGEGHGSRQTLCYRSTSPADDTVLVISNENVERHDTRVTSVFLGPLSLARVPPASCRPTSGVSRGLRFGTGPHRGASVESAARWLGVSPLQVERACARDVRPAAPTEDPDFSVSGLPDVCADDLDDSRTAHDREGTTYVRVGLRCDGKRVTAFSMDWSDWE